MIDRPLLFADWMPSMTVLFICLRKIDVCNQLSVNFTFYERASYDLITYNISKIRQKINLNISVLLYMLSTNDCEK